jgi:hypothetical protein
MNMRRLLLTAALALCPMLAMADESISGQWRADVGHGVLISMDVLADGHWLSQTVQNNKVVAEMAGTYEQTKTNATSGKLVFTPVKSKTTAEHGAAKVEDDTYTLADRGAVLNLTTAGETMVYHKQPYAK